MATSTANRAVIDLVINGQSANTTLLSVKQATKALYRELDRLKEADDPKLYKQRAAELQKMLATQQRMRAEITGTATGWQKIAGSIGTITGGLLGANLITAIPGQIAQASQKIVTFRSELSDVAKTTGMTKAEVKELNEELKLIDTVTPTRELREMAATGGQFGIAKDQVDEFTEAADKANVALGDQLGGAAGTAETLVKLRNIMQDIKSDKVDEDMLHIGNAINVLEAEGAATADVMADFTSRIGGVAIPMGMTSAQTLGLSAALQEMNVTAERGSSAVTDILIGMSKAPEGFAKYARAADGSKLSTKQFTDLVNTDLMGALLAVARGMNTGDKSATGFAKKLDAMGINGNGATEVLMKLGSNTELVTKRISQAEPALKSTGSILAEFAAKNDDLAKDLKFLDESFENLYTSEAVQNFVSGAVRGVVNLVKVLPQLFAWLKDNTTVLWAMIAATVVLNARLVETTLRTGYQTAALLYQKVAYEVGFRWLVLSTAAQEAYATVMAAGTLRTRIATAAQLLWNAALTANPIGLVVAAVGALVYALKYYSEHTERAQKVQRESNQLHKTATAVKEQHGKIQQDMNKWLARWNELSDKEKTTLEQNIRLRRQELSLRLQQLKVKSAEIAMQHADPSTWQTVTNLVLSGGNGVNFGAAQVQDRVGNIQSVAEGFKKDIQELEAEIKGYDEALTKVGELKSGKGGKGGSGGGGSSSTDKNKGKADPFREAMNQEMRTGAEHQDDLTEYQKEAIKHAERFAKLYALAGNHVDKIKEVDKLNLAAWAIVEANETKRQQEATKKKEAEDADQGYATLQKEADAEFTNKRRDTELKQQSGVSEEVKRQTELEQMQAYLTQKLLLQKLYAKDSTDTEAQLTENLHQQNLLRQQHEHDTAQMAEQVRAAKLAGDKQLYEEGVAGLRTFVAENTVAFKALLVAQKAFAIAEIIINTQRQIAQIWADPSYSIFGLAAIPSKIAASAFAGARGAASIATISGLAGREEGGYTGTNDLYVDKSGAPAGWVTRPTLFALGQRSYIAGEGHKKEYVIPYPMLKDPRVANIVGMLEAQRTGRMFYKGGYTAMTPTAPGLPTSMAGATGAEAMPAWVQALISEQQQTRAAFAEFAKKPWEFSYLALEKEQQYVDDIRSSVGQSKA